MAGFFKRRNYVRNTLGLNKSDFNQRYQAALSATDGGTRHERRDAALKSLMNDYSVSQADDLNTDYYSSVENSARSLIEQKYPKKTNGNTNAAAATPAVTPATPGAPVRVSLPEYDMDAWRSHLADWKNYVLNGGDRPSTFN